MGMMQRKYFSGLLIAILALGLASTTQAATLTYDGHQYMLVAGPTWTEANANAKSLGAEWNLVTINSAEEEDWLKTNFGTNQHWIGFTDQAQEGNWEWTSGEAVTYTNWASGEPNNVGDEDYAFMNYNGGWADIFNDGGLVHPAHPTLVQGIAEMSPVPLPAAAWLFISAIGGLVVTKRKQLKA